ncbi:MAG: hypothetical protein ACJA1L_003793 [Paracoccaceae bacterium]|jgi:hypothetical protein
MKNIMSKSLITAGLLAVTVAMPAYAEAPDLSFGDATGALA